MNKVNHISDPFNKMDHMMGQLYAEFKNNNNNNNDKGKGKEMTAENLDPTTPNRHQNAYHAGIFDENEQQDAEAHFGGSGEVRNDQDEEAPPPEAYPGHGIRSRTTQDITLTTISKTDSSELQILGVRRRRILDNKQHQRPPEDTEYLHKGVMDWKTNTKTLEQILLKQEKDYEMQIQNLRS
ncbi:MAG: hypothetical protein Q9198_001635 [Flavoplaca austrocitrina]